ncbi:MAG TPA: TetR/AcrR family transcriptional regulator [Pseudogracilibacillus sp.]|nr:TetR/AcrR family transcriptional regulator [Pseudogracilibacillus sp.]
MRSTSVQSSIKDVTLVAKRRAQIIQSAIYLFKQKGFHRTTTREIAEQAGFSIGTLYEYVRTKEDVLFLVYEAINDYVYEHLQAIIEKSEPSVTNIIAMIDHYFRLMDEMQEEVLILYQEIKSLPTEKRDIVLQQERDMVQLFKQAIMPLVAHTFTEKEIEVIVNNIFVQGQMWGFRRWLLQRTFTLDEYIQLQTKTILNMLHIDESHIAHRKNEEQL